MLRHCGDLIACSKGRPGVAYMEHGANTGLCRRPIVPMSDLLCALIDAGDRRHTRSIQDAPPGQEMRHPHSCTCRYCDCRLARRCVSLGGNPAACLRGSSRPRHRRSEQSRDAAWPVCHRCRTEPRKSSPGLHLSPSCATISATPTPSRWQAGGMASLPKCYHPCA